MVRLFSINKTKKKEHFSNLIPSICNCFFFGRGESFFEAEHLLRFLAISVGAYSRLGLDICSLNTAFGK